MVFVALWVGFLVAFTTRLTRGGAGGREATDTLAHLSVVSVGFFAWSHPCRAAFGLFGATCAYTFKSCTALSKVCVCFSLGCFSFGALRVDGRTLCFLAAHTFALQSIVIVGLCCGLLSSCTSYTFCLWTGSWLTLGACAAFSVECVRCLHELEPCTTI